MEEREATVLCNLPMKEGTLASCMTDGDSHHHIKSIVPRETWYILTLNFSSFKFNMLLFT